MNSTQVDTRRSLLQILLFVFAWVAFEYIFVRLLAFGWIALFLGGFVLWWYTTRRSPIDPRTIIVPYLLTVILFIAHVYDEYKSELLGLRRVMEGWPLPFPVNFELMVTFAATLGPIAWLLGAVMMLKRWNVGYFVASTFMFGMMFIEPLHLITPFSQPGPFHYVGGLWTAPPLIAMGWYTFFAFRREIKKAKEAHGGR